MKHSEIYQQAAKRLEERQDEYSCVAIRNVIGDDGLYSTTEKLKSEYLDLFVPRPGEDDFSNFWADWPSAQLQTAFESYDEQKRLNMRILALCFMAAMKERPR